MSITFLNAAFKASIKSSSAKLTLLSLADYANDDGIAYPSYHTLEIQTSCSRASVRRAINTLQHMGLLTKTGDRVGKTKRVPVYQLHLQAIHDLHVSNRVLNKRDQNEPVKKKWDQNDPIKRDHPDPIKWDQNDPRNHHKEPPIGTTSNADADFRYIPGLNVDAFDTWIAYRRKRKLARYASNQIAKKLATYPPETQREIVDYSMTQNYDGLVFDRFDKRDHASGDMNTAMVQCSKLINYINEYNQWDHTPFECDDAATLLIIESHGGIKRLRNLTSFELTQFRKDFLFQYPKMAQPATPKRDD